MQRRWLIGGVAALVVAVGGGVWWSVGSGNAADQAYRLAPVDRGSLTASVRATGTLNPVNTVLVGSQLSGLIVEILADYNSPVTEGQVLARLYAEQFRARRDAAAAALAQLTADLGQRKAQLEKAKATRLRADANLRDLGAQRDRTASQLADAKRTNDRQKDLFERGAGSASTYDTARTQMEVQTASLASSEAQIAAAKADLAGLDADIALAEAQIKSAEAQIQGARAKLTDTEIDLKNTEIRSPVNGVVVQRQVDLGQTVAASLNAPTLYTVAQDLHEIDIWANVDESDVGRVKEGQVVKFTVNAYPNRTYEGAVNQIRLGAQTVSNVVTYTTVVRVDNRDLSLLPGMTANLQVITDEHDNVLRVPNAALRFRPAVASAQPDDATARAKSASGQQAQGSSAAIRQLREKIAAELKPTPEQAKAIDDAIADLRASAPGRDPSLSPEERKAAIQAARKGLIERIASTLDPERRQRFVELVKAQAAAQGVKDASQGTPGRLYKLEANGQPAPINVVFGATDGNFTEILSGDAKEGAQVVTGGGPKAAADTAAKAPARPPGPPRLF